MKRDRRPRVSIRVKILIVFFLGLLIPILIAAWVSYRKAREVIRQGALERQAEVLFEITRDLLAQQDQSRRQLGALATDVSLHAALEQEMPVPETLVRTFMRLNGHWSDVTIRNADGRQVWSSEGHAATAGPLDRLFLDALIWGWAQTPVVPTARSHSTRFGFRISRDSRFFGVISARFDLDVLTPTLDRLRGMSAVRAFLWDDRGIVFGSNLTEPEREEVAAQLDLQETASNVRRATDGRIDRPLVLAGRPFLLVAASAPELITRRVSGPGESWFLATLTPTSQAFADLRSFQSRILVFLVLFFVATAVFLSWISHRVSRPLVEMAAFAEGVSRGEREVRLCLPGHDEVARLGDALNTMTEALRGYEQELVRNEVLASLGKMSSLVAHEIRNPLNGIRGAVQYLQLKFPEEPTLEEYCALMLDKIDGLARFVDSLLRFARLPVPEMRDTSVARLCDLAREPFGERIAQGRVELSRAAEESLEIHCDENQIGELLQNLVQNALDAIGGRGKIEIAARRVAQTVELRVADDGPGVPAAVRARLFVPFATSKAGGTGLGLVMCKMIAENHGGSLDYQASPAGGACFVLRLPLRAEAGRPL